jgi:hypothetical protein
VSNGSVPKYQENSVVLQVLLCLIAAENVRSGACKNCYIEFFFNNMMSNSYLVEDGTIVLDEGSDGGQALGVLLLLVSGLLLIGGYTVTKACRTPFRFPSDGKHSLIQRKLCKYKRTAATNSDLEEDYVKDKKK